MGCRSQPWSWSSEAASFRTWDEGLFRTYKRPNCRSQSSMAISISEQRSRIRRYSPRFNFFRQVSACRILAVGASLCFWIRWTTICCRPRFNCNRMAWNYLLERWVPLQEHHCRKPGRAMQRWVRRSFQHVQLRSPLQHHSRWPWLSWSSWELTVQHLDTQVPHWNWRQLYQHLERWWCQCEFHGRHQA